MLSADSMVELPKSPYSFPLNSEVSSLNFQPNICSDCIWVVARDLRCALLAAGSGENLSKRGVQDETDKDGSSG